MTTKHESLEKIGRGAMSAISEMVAALNCDYDRLAELRDEADCYEDEENGREGRAHWAEDHPDDAEELEELETAAGECEDQDAAYERIQEDPLSLEYRSGWSTDKDDLRAEEYCLLLTTGGPAVRIIGEIENGEATSARLEVQDWGTPWTEHVTTGADHDALLSYVRCFCFE